MFSISSDELDKSPPITGRTIVCDRCGETHELIADTDPDTGNPKPLDLAFLIAYRCGGELYLAGFNGKDIRGAPQGAGDAQEDI